MEAKEKLNEVAYKHIFDGILQGKFRPGTFLNIDDISASLNIAGVFAVVVGYLLLPIGATVAWRYMLMSAAIPAHHTQLPFHPSSCPGGLSCGPEKYPL